jgi:hypothetical protein
LPVVLRLRDELLRQGAAGRLEILGMHQQDSEPRRTRGYGGLRRRAGGAARRARGR